MTKKLYIPGANTPFELSRSKIDLFMECPKCFYLDRRIGIQRPPGYPFSLNNAVDALLKKEFDYYREKELPHPLMQENQINAVPYQNENLHNQTWRFNRKGIRYLDKNTNLEIFGSIDDLWIDNDTKEIMVVDYKATSKKDEVSLDADWQISYKRQVEVYQWLLRKNNLKISDLSYFVYCNGIKDKERFDQKLEFTTKIIPYKGDCSWVENTLNSIYDIINREEIPKKAPACSWCKYRDQE